MDIKLDLIVVQQSRNLTVSPSTVESSGFLTIAWDMPVDEASNMDWIGRIMTDIFQISYTNNFKLF